MMGRERSEGNYETHIYEMTFLLLYLYVVRSYVVRYTLSLRTVERSLKKHLHPIQTLNNNNNLFVEVEYEVIGSHIHISFRSYEEPVAVAYIPPERLSN